MRAALSFRPLTSFALALFTAAIFAPATETQTVADAPTGFEEWTRLSICADRGCCTQRNCVFTRSSASQL
jgi:hypothetical protein